MLHILTHKPVNIALNLSTFYDKIYLFTVQYRSRFYENVIILLVYDSNIWLHKAWEKEQNFLLNSCYIQAICYCTLPIQHAIIAPNVLHLVIYTRMYNPPLSLPPLCKTRHCSCFALRHCLLYA